MTTTRSVTWNARVINFSVTLAALSDGTTVTFDGPLEDTEDTVTFTFDNQLVPPNRDAFINNATNPNYFDNITNFEADQYLASHSDLIDRFGNLPYDEALDAATQHYIEVGFEQKRGLDTFNEDQYLNSFPDLIAAFGNDLSAATQHYIQSGFEEGRVF